MTTIRAFVKSHSLLSYVALTFAISWGTILLVIGPRGVPLNAEHVVTLMTLEVRRWITTLSDLCVRVSQRV